MTDPWLPPPSPYAAAPPPVVVVRQGPSKTAIAGLVTGSLALLGVLGIGLTFLLPFLFLGSFGFDEAAFDDMGLEEEYSLDGTLPQASAGREYTGEELVDEVERVLSADYSTHRGLECRPLVFAADAETTCTGTIDGFEEELRVEVEDDLGHFRLVRSW